MQTDCAQAPQPLAQTDRGCITHSLSLYHSLSVLCEHARTSLPVENRRETMEEDEDKLRTEIDKINNLLLTCTVYYLLYALY